MQTTKMRILKFWILVLCPLLVFGVNSFHEPIFEYTRLNVSQGGFDYQMGRLM